MCTQFFITELDTDLFQLGLKELLSPLCQNRHVESELNATVGCLVCLKLFRTRQRRVPFHHWSLSRLGCPKGCAHP
eukprot:9406089-Lingulodinium_polyedra.AAC.1